MNSSIGNPNRQRATSRLTSRLTQRQKMLLIGGAVSTMMIVLIVLFYQSTQTTPAKAAVTDEYRSKASGNWGSTTTWERFNGTTWVNAVSTPTSANNIITIRNGHTVTVAASVTADQLVIETGGRVNISATRTLTIANGTGTDISNSGILANSGTFTLSPSATAAHNAGGEYIHAINGGTIHTATWDAASICQISGVTTTIPLGLTQNFGDLNWNCGGLSTSLGINSSLSIQGDFIVTSTGANRLYLTDNGTARTLTIGGDYSQTGGEFRVAQSTGNGTMTVTGNLNHTGGNLQANNNSGTGTITVTGNVSKSGTGSIILVSGSGNVTMNVSGNFSFTAGTVDMNESSGNATLNIAGNYTHSGGTLTESGTGSSTINFNGTTMQTFTSGGTVSNIINYNVNNNAYLQMAAATTTVNGGGSFTVTNGGKLGITSTAGITSSGATGNIRVTGTRTFNTGADYEYNGTSTQTSGNGLPATVRKLTINNSAGVSLSGSVTASTELILTTGNVTTGGNTLTLGTSTSSTGTLTRTSGHIIGNFTRWMASSTATDILFPLGTATDYNGFNTSFTSAPTGGTIAASFTTGYPGNIGLPLNDAGDGNGFSGGTFTANAVAEGFTGISDYTKLHLFRRDNAISAWETTGTHAAPSGSPASPIVNRSGITSLGQFGITSDGSNPLPVQLTSFEVKENNGTVKITWTTTSEHNSDYFMVERSLDGSTYKDLKKVDAAGNSTTVRKYEVIDPSPATGMNYYRLRQVDINGQKEFFGPKSIRFGVKTTATSSLSNLSASPNPFSSGLSLNFESATEGTQTMRIYDQVGKQVFSGTLDVTTGANTIYLPLADKLSPGTYMVMIGEGEKVVKTRIVKQ
jgi:hypothetical protein